MAATEANYNPPPVVDSYQRTALIVGVVGLLLAVALAFLTGGPARFFRSYLVGFVFWCGIAIGSLAIMMLHHLSGGGWGLVVRRIFEAATRTVPLLAILFIPIAVSLFVHPVGEGGHSQSLYEWSDHHVVENDPILQAKAKYYLNIPFFLGRAVFYFLVWGGLAFLLSRFSRRQDETGDPRLKDWMQNVSGPGILLFGLTVTFASFDWMMSLEPHWFSTIYGFLIMAGWALTAFAFVILVASILQRHEPFTHVYLPAHFHDYGKLLLAFVMVYAYFSFSQFLIIWSANLPEEIPWYLRRLRGGWQYVGLAVVLFHFALPFVLLLSRTLKRNSRLLSRVALMVLVARMIDMVYLVSPAFVHEGQDPHFQPLDLLAMVGMTIGVGGIWLAYFIRELKGRPLLPINAPGLDEALAATGHH
ncbi:MAG: hypothetical protein H0T45_14170 [Pyrinomonadaceae bacterium]|nr:hypothetical protein [Pyrinomonadaceae bacterium]MDQ3134205.1 hypothetical protein [Acidobacteriota bacterium]